MSMLCMSSHLCIACPNCCVEVYTCDAGPCTNSKMQHLLPGGSDSISVLQAIELTCECQSNGFATSVLDAITLVE